MDSEVRVWRVRERERLKRERRSLSSVDRAALTDALSRNLDMVFQRLPPGTVGLYWPINGEFDLRAWAERLAAQKGWTLALPVVVRERAPLEYWRWRQGDPMTRGFWNIMVPERRDSVTPSVVLAPLLGFSGLYRLGYGGGYFDRTLAVIEPKPFAVGIGTESCRTEGYIPQSHDVPMDIIVTEAGIRRGADHVPQ